MMTQVKDKLYRDVIRFTLTFQVSVETIISAKECIMISIPCL